MQGGARANVVGRSVAAAGGATIGYFTLQAGATWLLSPTLPPVPEPGPAGFAILVLAILYFAGVAVLQILAPARLDSPGWRAARVHVANGFYANALFNRLVGALKRPAADLS